MSNDLINMVERPFRIRIVAEDRAAEQRFHQFLRRPFVAWRDQQQSLRRAA